MAVLHMKQIDICTFVVIYRWILLRMRSVSDKSCRENPNTHFVSNNFLFRKLCRLWGNVQQRGTAVHATDDSIIWRMRIAWWTPNATDTHSEYVTLNALALQQWLHEHVSMLRHTYIVISMLVPLLATMAYRDIWSIPPLILHLRQRTQVPVGRLGGFQSRSGRSEKTKITSSAWIRTPDRSATTLWLYRLSHRGCLFYEIN